jgi:hypothetical protein
MWYIIVAFIVWIVVSIYFSKGKVFSLLDDVLLPAFIVAVLWPLLVLLFILVVLFISACLPVYLIYVIILYLINKKIIKK